ncbi:MAG: hypothetical protein L0271_09525 [Gemmatimonadetes bacterium]|nr:hypothetical protein [Gemmatimonadota bacterium]
MSRTLQATRIEGSIFDCCGIPGAFTFAENDSHLIYGCPCCGEPRAVPIFTGTKVEKAWLWDGNREAPTLSPSIRHRGDLCTPPACSWHGWLRAGVWMWA